MADASTSRVDLPSPHDRPGIPIPHVDTGQRDPLKQVLHGVARTLVRGGKLQLRKTTVCDTLQHRVDHKGQHAAAQNKRPASKRVESQVSTVTWRTCNPFVTGCAGACVSHLCLRRAHASGAQLCVLKLWSCT
jgi:hypothetical protein